MSIVARTLHPEWNFSSDQPVPPRLQATGRSSPDDSSALNDPEALVKRDVDSQPDGSGTMPYPGDRSALLSGGPRDGDGEEVHTGRSRQKESHSALAYLHWAAAIASLWLADKAVAKLAKSAHVDFPPPLIGMFIIIAGLVGSSAVSESGCQKIEAFFKPALVWIQRWLPLFYVPSLIMLPLTLNTINGVALTKILSIIAIGMPFTLLVTAQVAIVIRRISQTELEPAKPEAQLPPFSKVHHIAWGATWLVSLAGCALSSSAQVTRYASSSYMLASTVGGYLIGCALPAKLTAFLHPMITTACLANFSALLMGTLTGAGYETTLRGFLTKNAAQQGAGDLLMSFLGVVILTFGFKIFSQRRLMVRHAPEIFGSTTASAAFSIFATAFAAKAAGLAPELARALVPRCVTIALALPMAAALHAPAGICVAGVALSGLLGANFGQAILSRFGFRDPIARGLSQAGAAHGLGTAAIASDEPEALPFCALAYALIGIISTVLVSIPAVRGSIFAITA
ncbi:hypothetical protein WJX73_007719 [Symbiochloris irregularis]|uniref:LrgB-like protein n=1 Tax=Symbiochloris irregularis TaxID=706552 RepID=A0AAW1PFT8_9CHLO